MSVEMDGDSQALGGRGGQLTQVVPFNQAGLGRGTEQGVDITAGRMECSLPSSFHALDSKGQCPRASFS